MKVEILEAEACPDHIHMLVSIPPYMSIAQFVGTLKSKSALMLFDRHASLKYRYGNRNFWCRGYYVDTVDEVKRMVNWQKVMPAFGTSEAKTQITADRLTDTWRFNAGETWLSSAIGTYVDQSAPAVISRGMPLPEVRSKTEKPFVTCACRKECAAVAVHGRTKADNSWYVPEADIEVMVAPDTRDIAVFGKMHTLSIQGVALKGRKALVSDLASDRKHSVVLENSTLSGKQLAEWGLADATEGDVSDPGVRITLL